MRELRTFTPALLLVFVCVSAPAQSTSGTVDVTTLGASKDGTNAIATTAAFQYAFIHYSNGKIIVPPGNYAIDNSTSPILIQNFSGELEFQGDAQVIFQSTAYGGFWFTGGTNTRIHGMHGTYATVPSNRTGEEFSFTSMTDITVEDSIARNSPGMGFLFTLCVRPKASNISVDFAIADGLAFSNSQDAQIVNFTAQNTIDNGLAFYNYALYDDLNGGTANNVHITHVGAHGIAIVGTSNVTVSGFIVDLTYGSGVWVSQDSVYNTRYPANVTIQQGVINAAGQIQPPFYTNFGLEYTNSDNVTFADIQITGPQSRGVSGTSPTGHMRFHNVRVVNNSTGDAFVIGQTAEVEMVDCTSVNSPGAGFTFTGVSMLIARQLKVVDASSQSTLRRAIWFQDGGIISAADLMVIDDRPVPFGYIIGTAETTRPGQTGSIQGILTAIANGTLTLQSYSPGVKVVNVR